MNCRTPPPAQEGADRQQRLPAHGIGAADEQHLHLLVVEARRVLAEIPVRLVVEIAEIVVRKVADPGRGLPDVVETVAPTPRRHRRQVAEIAQRIGEQLPGLVGKGGRYPVDAVADVAPVLSQQHVNIFEQFGQRRRPPGGRRWSGPLSGRRTT